MPKKKKKSVLQKQRDDRERKRQQSNIQTHGEFALKANPSAWEKKEPQNTDNAVKKVKETLKTDTAVKKVKETLNTDPDVKNVKETLKLNTVVKKVKETLNTDTAVKTVKDTLDTDTTVKKVKETLKTDTAVKKVKEALNTDPVVKNVKETLKLDTVVKKVKETLYTDTAVKKMKETLNTDTTVKKVKGTLKTDTGVKKVKETLNTDKAVKKVKQTLNTDPFVTNVKETLKLDPVVKKVKETLNTDTAVEKAKETLNTDKAVKKVKGTLNTDTAVKKKKETLNTDKAVKKVKETLNTDPVVKNVKETLKLDTVVKKVKETLNTDTAVKEVKDTLNTDNAVKKVKETLNTDPVKAVKKVKEILKLDTDVKKVKETLYADTAVKKEKETLNTETAVKEVKDTLNTDNAVKKTKETLNTDPVKAVKKVKELLKLDTDVKKVKETLHTDPVVKKVKKALNTDPVVKKVKETLNTDPVVKNVKETLKLGTFVKKVKETLNTDTAVKKVKDTLNTDNAVKKVKEKLDTDPVKAVKKVKEILNTDPAVKNEKETLKLDTVVKKVKVTLNTDKAVKKMKETLNIHPVVKKVKETLNTDKAVKKMKETLNTDPVVKKVKETLNTYTAVKKVKGTLKTDKVSKKVKETLKLDTDVKKVKETLNTDPDVQKVKETLKTDTAVQKVKGTLKTDIAFQKVKEKLNIDTAVKNVKEPLNLDKAVKKVKETLNTDPVVKNVKEIVKLDTAVKEVKETLNTDKAVKKVKETMNTDKAVKNVKETLNTEYVDKNAKETLKTDTAVQKVKETLNTDTAVKKVKETLNTDKAVKKVKETLNTDTVVKTVKETLNTDKAVKKVKETLNTDTAVKKVKETLDTDRAVKKVKETLNTDTAVKKAKATLNTDTAFKKVNKTLKASTAFKKVKETLNTDYANKKMKESLKTIDEAKAREKKTSAETNDLGQDTGEKNIHILQMVFHTQDTFENDSFVAEPLESEYKQSNRSLHNIGNQNIPDNDSLDMDLQQRVMHSGGKESPCNRKFLTKTSYKSIDIPEVKPTARKTDDKLNVQGTILTDGETTHEDTTNDGNRTVTYTPSISAENIYIYKEIERQTKWLKMKKNKITSKDQRNRDLDMARYKMKINRMKRHVHDIKEKKRKGDSEHFQIEEDKTVKRQEKKNTKIKVIVKMTDEQKADSHARDRKRKAEVTPLMSEPEKKRKQNKMAKAKSRLKMRDEQKAESLAKDRKRKAEETALMTEPEKKARAKQIKLATSKTRLKMTDEQKAENLANDRKRKAEETALMTEPEKKARAKQIKLAMAKSRLKMTDEQKAESLAKDRKRKAEETALMTEPEKKARVKQIKIATSKTRLKMTDQQKAESLAKDRKRKAEETALMTEPEKKARVKQIKIATSKTRLKMTDQQKAESLAKDRKHKAEVTALMTEPEKKAREKQKKITKAKSRLKMTDQQKAESLAKDRNHKAEQQLSLTESERTVRRHKNKAVKSAQRSALSDEEKKKKKLLDRVGKHEKRFSLTETENKAIQTFRALVKEGPVFVCTSCHRLMYRENVTIFERSSYSKCDDAILARCVSGYYHSDNKQYICQTCQWNLKRNKIPGQSIGNGLQLDTIPDELQNLSALESMLISKRVPFMKVLALPRLKQRAIHGCVVNVPVNPEETYSVLPRLPSSSSMITVKLKRKLQYRGHVIKQSVRPWRVLQALYHLKHTANNPHYNDIVINEHWDEDAAHDNEELWSSMTANEEPTEENSFHIRPAEVDKMEKSTEDTNDSDQEEETHDEEDTAQLRGLPFDSCLEPKDMSSDKDLLLSIAPGEGKKPLSLYSDKNNEELAFPTLFPNGRFGWEHKRDQKLTLKKYFNARLLNVDGRFAQSTEYLFYAQYRCEAEDVANSLSIGLRKCKGKAQNITAGQLKDTEEIRKLIRNDLNINFLQKVRGSPAYYNKLLFDLLGMVRQLGNCTWFLTLSAADLKWTDTIQIIAAQNGQHLSDEDVCNLTWEQKCLWLRTNPVTAARHFDHRLQTFMKTLIMGNSHPIGHIQDFEYRIEFQQRGSPHAHMLIWVKDAPQVKDGNPKVVSQFVDQYITCSVPSDDEELAELVKTVQKHSHSAACRKPGKSCRFSFPRPPLDETTVLYPAEEPVTEQAKGIYSDTLTTIYDKLSSLESDTDPSLAEILEDLQIPLPLYLKALQWIKTKQGRPTVLIKRKPKEGCINFYNPVLLKAWQANMDIQIVDHVESCIMYVSSYISKPEKALGDVLKSVSKTCEPQGPKKMMQLVSKKFLSHREVSAQEAVYRVLSLPLIRGSRQVIFVPTDLPENRTKLLKPLKKIQELDDDDEDLYMSGMLEKYADRPHSVENLCLADFSSYYCYGGKPKDKEPELDDFPGSEAEEDPTKENLEALPKTIQLKTTKQKLKRRAKPAIIRTHQYSQLQQEEEFYHSKLLLYLPWRNEDNDLKGEDGTFKSKFITEVDKFTTKMTEYEPNAQEYNKAVQNLMENGPPEDSWATLAAQTEQERMEDRQQGPTDDPDFSAIVPPEDAQPADLGLQHAEYGHELSSVSTQDWLNMILSLNEEQKPVHQFVLEWCTKMSLTYKTTKRPDPFHLFLTGGAGVGKSHVIKTIVQTVRRRLSVGQAEDDVTVMVCAFMGSAAFNVDGYTLHSSFNLPLTESKKDDYIRLSNEQLSTMRSKLGNLALLIIDEISMVGSNHLLTIHRRLAEIMNSDEPFGGVSVLAVGDLYQLPPVGLFPIYTPPTDPLAALYGSLWKKHFKIIELTQIMRQKNDIQFADALNRFRTEDQTEEDIELIKTRNVDNLGVPAPPEALHIYALNKDVDAHNEKMLNILCEEIITIKSIDSKTDQQTGRIENISLKEKESQLWKEIKVAVGARVMLTKNVDVTDGLANTAMGTITGFIPSPPASDHPDFSTYRPKYILVHFDEERVGRRRRQKYKHLIPDEVSVPIAAIEVPVRHKGVTAKRTQFPLALAWAITIHKAQGKTVDELVVSMNGSFRCGQLYTALSRVKTIDGLYILGEFEASKVKADSRSKEEMMRFRLHSQFKLSAPATVTVSPALYFKMSLININSLKPHFKCLASDKRVVCSDVVTLTETWLRPRDASVDFSMPDKLLSRQDSQQTRRGPNGGIATYLSQQYRLEERYQINIPQLQHLSLLLHDRADPSARLLIITVYNPPNTACGAFLKQLDMLLTRMPCDSVPTILCGDFNVNCLKEDSASKSLATITKYYGFQQYVSTTTHRVGAALDHVYVNKNLHHTLILTSTPVPYTDHFHVQIAVPFRALFM